MVFAMMATSATIVACHEEDPNRRRRGGGDFFKSPKSKLQEEDLPLFSSKQVKTLGNGEDGRPMWISYGGYVYDISRFLPLHPGGPERISRAVGAALEPYWYWHQQHFQSQEPIDILEQMKIGRLDPADQEVIDSDLELLESQLEAYRLHLVISSDIDQQEQISLFSLDDLKGLPQNDLVSTTGCKNSSRNQLATSSFSGVLLSDLVRDSQSAAAAGKINQNVASIDFYAMDGEKVSMNLEHQADASIDLTEILLCYEMNGAPLTAQRGFPLRVILPGKRVIKWVERIELKRK